MGYFKRRRQQKVRAIFNYLLQESYIQAGDDGWELTDKGRNELLDHAQRFLEELYRQAMEGVDGATH